MGQAYRRHPATAATVVYAVPSLANHRLTLGMDMLPCIEVLYSLLNTLPLLQA